jgi:hypothetical protein
VSEADVFHPVAERLRAYRLGRLEPAEAAKIRAHLARCAACRADLDTTDSGGVHEAVTMTPEASAAALELAEVPVPLVDHPRYRILELLGQGGMGAVYKAEHRVMERLVALKVINSNLVGGPAAVQRFEQEVKAAARLAHPHIVAAHDAEQAGGLHFLVMEYVDGISLADVITKRGPLPVAQACECVRQAALGLQHAHEKGMVHRDIKPHNLMLNRDGCVKILDFGLARLASERGAASIADAKSGLTVAGAIVGTPDYIAPEQAKDARKADIRADIYSLGCTLYDLLAGRPPFPDGSVLLKLIAHAEHAPTPVRTLRADVPAELAAVLSRMMAKDPAARFQTPAEVAKALAPFAKGDTVRSVAAALPARVQRAVRVESPSVRRTAAPSVRRAPASRKPARKPYKQLIVAGLVLAGLLIATLVPVGLVLYQLLTSEGEVVLSADESDLEIVVRQGEDGVALLGGHGQRQARLNSGEYTVELLHDQLGVRLVPDHFNLARGGRQVIEVVRAPKPKARPEAAKRPPGGPPGQPPAPGPRGDQ